MRIYSGSRKTCSLKSCTYSDCITTEQNSLRCDTRSEGEFVTVDAGERTKLRVAKRIRGLQRQSFSGSGSEVLYSESGRTSSQANVRGGIHGVAQEIGDCVRS